MTIKDATEIAAVVEATMELTTPSFAVSEGLIVLLTCMHVEVHVHVHVYACVHVNIYMVYT